MKPRSWEAPSLLLYQFVQMAPKELYLWSNKWGEAWQPVPPYAHDHITSVRVVFRSFGRQQLRFGLIGEFPEDQGNARIGRYVAEDAAQTSEAAVYRLFFMAADPTLRNIQDNHKLMEIFSG